jgi:HK97 family phage major capsid protein
MNKLEEAKLKNDLEMRSLQEQLTAGTVTADAAREKLENLRSDREKIVQEIAQSKADLGAGAKAADLVDAMKEQRAITLNGTGAINQVQEIAKELSAKTPVLERVRKFYGQNASTNIPVLSPGLATPATAAEGATLVGKDTQAVLGVKTLTPHAFVSILPVSAETLAMGSVDLESALPAIFADAFAQGFHNQILTGDGTGLNFLGLFPAVPTANQIPCAAAGAPTIGDLVNLAVSISDLTDRGVIIMAPSIYASILADPTTGVADVYKEQLVRDKRIENVPVILTSAAPSSTAEGSLVAVAGALDDYGLALASEIRVTPVKAVADTNTYFEAIIFANGAPVLNKNFYGLVAIEE